MYLCFYLNAVSTANNSIHLHFKDRNIIHDCLRILGHMLGHADTFPGFKIKPKIVNTSSWVGGEWMILLDMIKINLELISTDYQLAAITCFLIAMIMSKN